MFALLERFGKPSWLILVCFGPQKMSNNPDKLVPKSVIVFVVFWINFGTILGSILEPKPFQKKNPKLDQFWNPLAPPKRGPGVAILGIKRKW